MANQDNQELPPHVVLMQLVPGFMISKALQAVAELGIADLLEKSPTTSEELAEATCTHAPSLYRLLRALASKGIFRELLSRTGFKLTMAKPLPASVGIVEGIPV